MGGKRYKKPRRRKLVASVSVQNRPSEAVRADVTADARYQVKWNAIMGATLALLTVSFGGWTIKGCLDEGRQSVTGHYTVSPAVMAKMARQLEENADDNPLGYPSPAFFEDFIRGLEVDLRADNTSELHMVGMSFPAHYRVFDDHVELALDDFQGAKEKLLAYVKTRLGRMRFDNPLVTKAIIFQRSAVPGRLLFPLIHERIDASGNKQEAPEADEELYLERRR